jgi:hypothetical protein
MVGAIPAYVFQVVMFARDPHALLGVSNTGHFGGLVAQEVILKLIHPGIGKH